MWIGCRYLLIFSLSVLRILLKVCLLPRVKVNLKLPLYTSCRHIGGEEVLLHTFSTIELDGGEWSASLPDCFTSGERTCSTYRIGGWVGSRAGMDVLKKRDISCSLQALNLGLSNP
jgi:hypothetical protein